MKIKKKYLLGTSEKANRKSVQERGQFWTDWSQKTSQPQGIGNTEKGELFQGLPLKVMKMLVNSYIGDLVDCIRMSYSRNSCAKSPQEEWKVQGKCVFISETIICVVD